MVGSARTERCPAFAETSAFGNVATTQSKASFFQPVKIKQEKKLILWNVMHNDA